MPKDDVIDKDMGFFDAQKAIADADDLTITVGITGRPRYPKKQGGKRVAEVAGVHQVKKGWYTRIIDMRSEKWSREKAFLHDQVLKGRSAKEAAKRIGESIKKDLQEELDRLGLVDTGRLRKSISVSVKDPAARRRAYEHIKARGYSRKK